MKEFGIEKKPVRLYIVQVKAYLSWPRYTLLSKVATLIGRKGPPKNCAALNFQILKILFLEKQSGRRRDSD